MVARRPRGDASADPVRQLRVLRRSPVPSRAEDPKIGDRYAIDRHNAKDLPVNEPFFTRPKDEGVPVSTEVNNVRNNRPELLDPMKLET